MFALITDKESSVVWSKPQGIRADRKGEFRRSLHWNSGKTTVLMCDGTVLSVPNTTKPESWIDAIIIRGERTFDPFPN